MKRIIIMVLILSFLLIVFCSCGKKDESSSTSNALFLKAESVLNELPKDERIEDFKKVYNILTNLSTKEKQFLKQLESARTIAEKHDFSLESADWYFQRVSSVNSEAIDDYINRRIDHDISIALAKMIAPSLFQKYGHDVKHIREVSKVDVLSAVQNLGYYCESTKEIDERTKCVKETWKNPHYSIGDYTVNYHGNGLVEWLEVPLLETEMFENDEEMHVFFNEDKQRQEEIVRGVIDELLQSFSGFKKEKTVLSLIYTEEELFVLENYIKTLTSEYLWANSEATSNGGVLILCYKDTVIYVYFGLGTIKLDITARNDINEFSSRWYILEGGFAGTTEYQNYIEEEYGDYINKNIDVNENVPDGVIDLNGVDEIRYGDGSAKNFISDDVQMSTPGLLSSYIGKTVSDVRNSFGNDYSFEGYEGTSVMAYYDKGITFFLEKYSSSTPSNSDRIIAVTSNDEIKVFEKLSGNMSYSEIVKAIGSEVSLEQPRKYFDEHDGREEYNLQFDYKGYDVSFIWFDDPNINKSSYVRASKR